MLGWLNDRDEGIGISGILDALAEKVCSMDTTIPIVVETHPGWVVHLPAILKKLRKVFHQG